MSNLYNAQLNMWRTRREIILSEFENGMALVEIGRKWKISRERARQLVAQARKERDGDTKKRD